MNGTVIGKNCEINKAIIAERAVIKDDVRLGIGEEVDSDLNPGIYNHGIVTIGEGSVIPEKITVGKNTVIFGVTELADYENHCLKSGKSLVKAGE